MAVLYPCLSSTAYFLADFVYHTVHYSDHGSGSAHCSAPGFDDYSDHGAGTDYNFQNASQRLGSVVGHGDQAVSAAKEWGLSSGSGNGPKCGREPDPQTVATIFEPRPRPSPIKQPCELIYPAV